MDAGGSEEYLKQKAAELASDEELDNPNKFVSYKDTTDRDEYWKQKYEEIQKAK